LLKKQELQSRLKNNANTKEIITEMMRITQRILKIDENLKGRILKQNARNSLTKFVANTKNVFSNALNTGSDVHEEYILNYIELRAKMLGRNTTNLKRVNAASKKRLPTPAEITAGGKTMNVTLAAAKKSGNLNFLTQMRRLKNFRNLNAVTRGNKLRVISNTLKSTYNPNITNLRYRINNARTIQNLNSIKTNLNTQDSKLEQIYTFLMSNMPVGSGYNGVTPNARKYSLSSLAALRSRVEEAQVDMAAKSARLREQLTPQQIQQANEMANVVFQPPNNTGAGNMFAEPTLQRAPSLKRQRQAPPPSIAATRSRRLRA
jgi:hypothetical protein